MFTTINDSIFPFANLMNALTAGSDELTAPRINIQKANDALILSIVAPGFAKDEFSIDVDGQRLKIAARAFRTDTQSESEQQNPNYVRCEFVLTDFERTFNLPESVDSDAITATHANGILTLRLPHRAEAKLQRSIAIG